MVTLITNSEFDYLLVAYEFRRISLKHISKCIGNLIEVLSLPPTGEITDLELD